MVIFLRRAKQEVDEADEWWRANRAMPDAVLDAVGRVIALVSAQPHIGAPFETRRIRGCRRLLLSEVG